MLALLGMISAKEAAIPWPSVMCCDLRRRLAWADATAAAVYASHLLEHLYRDQARRFLGECHRVLAPGGVIRLMVPDLEALVLSYMEARSTDAGDDAELPADRFMTDTGLCSPAAPRGPVGLRLYRILTEFDSHKWLYDGRSLVALVREAGFAEAAVSPRHVSRIDDIHVVETNVGLIVEAVKPA